ncbi:Alpha/Beta hydrolase protein [Xylariales sp. AK1849]|nr:Alpha/Beta hydrolase protein [Xylariales sp. AK1849]
MPALDSFELPDTFSHNGWSIRYLARCKENVPKPWVVFVHGTPWCSDVFRPITEALYATDLFNIVLYDLAGYGQSQVFNSREIHEPDMSVKAQGQALAALLHHLNLDGKDEERRPHIVAHDIAGVISLRTHLLHGCEYRSLCLLDTNCVLPWGDKLYNLVRSNPRVFEELPPNVFEGCLRAIIQSARVGGQGLGAEWVDILARPWLVCGVSASDLQYNPQANFVRQIRQSDDEHTAELLDNDLYAQVRCDVKILWGERDEWIPYEKMQSLARMLGSRQKVFVTVPNAGHLLMLDQPERVTLEIGRWLERQA